VTVLVAAPPRRRVCLVAGASLGTRAHEGMIDQ